MTAEIEQLLKETIGLDAAAVGRPMIEYAVRTRMTRCGAKKPEDYCQQLRSSDVEMRELIEAVVVPETSFFRDRESFAALAQIVTAEWLPAHSISVLNVLSAPCSSGEEPYSIAMALLDVGFPAERFEIDAVDFSRRALGLGKRASYGRNSFRNKDLNFRNRYFRLTNDRYELAESVRARVHFQQGNLLAADFLAGESYDIIFCRNVLIYFDGPTQKRVIRTLTRLLAPQGCLFVGASEAFVLRGSGFTSADHAQAFAYRKTDVVKPAAIIRPVRPRKEIKPAAVSKPAKPKPEKLRELAPADLETACRLADAGRLAEAATACEAYLRIQGASAAGYYLLGLVRDAMDDQPKAADLYRKALYLEPDHTEALMHLALLSRKSGDVAAAKRLQLRAQRAAQISSPLSILSLDSRIRARTITDGRHAR
jgi:chemotaxis protein methyltransferase WspC